ncbi:helicase domain protein [Nitzschia inconspicua]|uniref:Helicase domain protein n=1 Tax=Nitzschia inconspicua TaxID=303405 RepID=A0A9K3KP70_9STRA|nr:helicase domain protein [Nitzschia inconspicua]
MQRSCSYGFRESAVQEVDNNLKIRRKRWNGSNEFSSKRRITPISPPLFTSITVVAAAAVAVYTVLIADAFSTNSPHHYRIQTFNEPQIRWSSGDPFQLKTLVYRKLPSFVSTTSTQLLLSSRGSSGKSSDQAEWKAVLMALQLYKAAYGDLKVPMLFVVPSMAPWPEAAWGLKLGKKVGAIRENGLYVGNNEKRRQKLESLGFIWRVRAPKNSAVDAADFTAPFDQIYDALVVYRSEIKPSGPLTVPVEFTVPDAEPWPETTRGLPLGRSIEQLRSEKYLDQYPDAKEKLEQIGFETDKEMSANDKRFQAVYVALERYKEIYGDVLVPQPFVVPSDSPDWPEESWGLRLGARVNAIRSQGTFIKNNEERRELLDAIGFVWTPPEKESKRKQGRKTLSEIDAEERQALIEAANQAGGMPVGTDTYDDDVESFLSSFDFSSEDDEDDESYRDSSVAPRTWGFESDSPSEETASLSPKDSYEREKEEDYVAPRTLGESLSEARQRALEAGVIEDTDSKRAVKRKRDADIPWFNDDFGGDFVFEDVIEALTLYKQFYGDFSNLTNAEFIIPITGEPGLSFDDDIEFDDNDSMKAIAAEVTRFDEIDDSSMTEDQFEAEIRKLEQDMLAPQYKGKTEVTTLKPISAVEWPEHLEGMRLGDIARRIRDGSLEVKHLTERKVQLDAIDFDWGDPLHFIDVPFEKAMCAMYAYYMIRGDMFVPPDFVMLDEDPWPQALAGYELGKVVKRIRELQNFFEAFHTEKVGLLRMVDFVWFPTLALPIDPNEKEMSAEMLIVGALGHPDYAFLEEWQELPFGLADKIISEGPFYDVSDDPRKWWREWHNWDYVEDLWYNVGTRDRAVQLRRTGFPQLADEHEAKYGPGLFQEVDDYLDNLVAKLGGDGFQRILGVEDAKKFFTQLDLLDDLKERWPSCTSDQDTFDLMVEFGITTVLEERGLSNRTLRELFGKLDGQFFRTSQLSDPVLEEMKQTLYGYYDELKDSIDLPPRELKVLWLDRLKLFLCAVQIEVFNTELGKGGEEETQSSRRKSKDKTFGRESTDQDLRNRLGRVEEEELEDIYEEYEEEENDGGDYEEEYYDTEEDWSDETSEDEEDII